jgi:hypothetical protein
MEASVVRSPTRVSIGVPHCQVCVLFLGQPVPIIATGRGYALFCEQCALGHNAPVVRVRDAKKMQITVDGDPAAVAGSSEEE